MPYRVVIHTWSVNTTYTKPKEAISTFVAQTVLAYDSELWQATYLWRVPYVYTQVTRVLKIFLILDHYFRLSDTTVVSNGSRQVAKPICILTHLSLMLAAPKACPHFFADFNRLAVFARYALQRTLSVPMHGMGVILNSPTWIHQCM